MLILSKFFDRISGWTGFTRRLSLKSFHQDTDACRSNESHRRPCLKLLLRRISLCNLCVLCVSVVCFYSEFINHRDTENTEAAQRRAFRVYDVPTRYSEVALMAKVPGLRFLCATSVFSVSLWCVFARNSSTTETQRTPRLHREERRSDF